MPKVMKGYPLALPDDPDVRDLFENIYVSNTGDVLIRCSEAAVAGVARRMAVLRDIAEGFHGPGMLGIPVALGSGMLRLKFSRNEVMSISDSSAQMFGLRELAGMQPVYRPAFSVDEICDAIETIDEVLNEASVGLGPTDEQRQVLRTLRDKLADTEGSR